MLSACHAVIKFIIQSIVTIADIIKDAFIIILYINSNMKMRELINIVQSLNENVNSEDAGWQQMQSDPEGSQILANPKYFSQEQELVNQDMGNGQVQQVLKTSYIYSLTPNSTKHIVNVISSANNKDEIISSSYQKIPTTA